MLSSGSFKDIQTVGPDEFPMYEQETEKTALALPQGAGSGTNADTVDSFQAVSASKAGPNKLVATGSSGKLPLSIIPAIPSGTFLVTNRAGTQSYVLYVEDDGALSYDPV